MKNPDGQVFPGDTNKNGGAMEQPASTPGDFPGPVQEAGSAAGIPGDPLVDQGPGYAQV